MDPTGQKVFNGRYRHFKFMDSFSLNCQNEAFLKKVVSGFKTLCSLCTLVKARAAGSSGSLKFCTDLTVFETFVPAASQQRKRNRPMPGGLV